MHTPVEVTERVTARAVADAARLMFERGIAAVAAPGRPLGCMISSGLLMTSADNAGLAADLTAHRASARKALDGAPADELRAVAALALTSWPARSPLRQ